MSRHTDTINVAAASICSSLLTDVVKKRKNEQMQLTVVHVRRVYTMRDVYHDAASRETSTRSQMIFEPLQMSDRCDT